jgi:hypothetical protein
LAIIHTEFSGAFSSKFFLTALTRRSLVSVQGINHLGVTFHLSNFAKPVTLLRSCDLLFSLTKQILFSPQELLSRQLKLKQPPELRI